MQLPTFAGYQIRLNRQGKPTHFNVLKEEKDGVPINGIQFQTEERGETKKKKWQKLIETHPETHQDIADASQMPGNDPERDISLYIGSLRQLPEHPIVKECLQMLSNNQVSFKEPELNKLYVTKDENIGNWS